MLFVIATQVTQENLQDSAADYVIVPGNQQGVYYPTYPHSGPIPTPPPVFWNPEIGWWAYYPYSYEQHPYLTPCYYYHPEQFCGVDTDGSLMTMTQLPPDELNVINNVSDVCCTSPFRGNPLSRNSALYVGSQWSYEESSTTPTSCTTTTTASTEQSPDRLMPVEDENKKEQGQQQEQIIAASSTLSSLPSETEDSESEDGDILNDDSSSCSSSKPNNDKENASAESSSDSSSSDSDSYLAYSTGLNPLRKDMVSQEVVEEEQEAEKSDVQDTDDATDCEKESILEDDENADDDDDDEEIITENEEHNDEDEKTYQESVQDDIDGTTVSVSLPLRIKFSASEHDEDVTTVIVGDSTVIKDVDTCVDFTLKRPSILEPLQETDIEETIHIKPRFVVTATDEEEQTKVSEEMLTEEINEDDIVEMDTSLEEKRKTLLSVQQSHSREEVTDDEDSGVTSDMSRIISEVDTDSECCMTTAPTTPITPTMPMPPLMPITPTTVVTSPVVKRANQNKYQRTQTHSRLFRLLSDEQMKLPTISNGSEEHSSNSSGITSPDCTDQPADVLASARHQLPTRPKSLDCEALFKKHQQQSTDPQDPYYQTWKNGERRRSAAISPSNAVQWTVPKARVTVACPRVRSAKNVPQTLALRNSYYQYQSRTKPSSPLGSTTILSPSYIPHPVRTNDNRRC